MDEPLDPSRINREGEVTEEGSKNVGAEGQGTDFTDPSTSE